MFNFRRKKKQNLIIRITDVIEIIRSDYENGLAFCLIDFQYHNEVHCMGSCVYPQNAEERKENIRFVFDSEMFETVEGEHHATHASKMPALRETGQLVPRMGSENTGGIPLREMRRMLERRAG